MIFCIVLITIFLWVTLRGKEAWPFSAYPMFSQRRDISQVEVVRVALETQAGELIWWQPHFYRYPEAIGRNLKRLYALQQGIATSLELLAHQQKICADVIRLLHQEKGNLQHYRSILLIRRNLIKDVSQVAGKKLSFRTKYWQKFHSHLYMNMNFGNFFCPADHNGVRIFLILFCITTVVQFGIHCREQFRFFQSEPILVYGNLPRIFAWIQMPPLSNGQFILAGYCFGLGLLGATLGIAPQLFLLVAFVAYFFYFSQIMPLSYIQRKTNLIPIVILILFFAPGLAQPLAQPTPVWSLFLVKVSLVQIYFSAGLQKLRRSGWQWSDGCSLQAYLAEHYLWADTRLAWWLTQRLWLCRWLSRLTLIFELSVGLILVFPSLTFGFALSGILFHLGTGLTMRIHYLIYISPVYTIFIAEYLI